MSRSWTALSTRRPYWLAKWQEAPKSSGTRIAWGEGFLNSSALQLVGLSDEVSSRGS
jgi:hypothetical protein